MECPFNFVVSPPDVNSALLSGLVQWGQKGRCPRWAQPRWQLPQCVGGLVFGSLAHPLAITEENQG